MSKAMQNKFYLILFLLCLSITAFAAKKKDTKEHVLFVSLSESDSLYSVNLVFENTSTDTVVMLNKFKRFLDEWEVITGIMVRQFCNRKDLGISNYPPMDEIIKLGNEKVLCFPPNSKISFNINIKDYFDQVKDGELGVRFILNYTYVRRNKNANPVSIRTFETNYAKVKSKPSPLDRRHELLFDCVYQHNNLSNREYKRTMPFVYNRDTTIAVGYTATEENEWINQWRISSWNELKIAENITKKIRDTKIGRRIPNIVLTAKNIYTGTFVHNGVYYPAAFYSEKDTIKEVLKIQVSDIDRLDKKWNRRYINCDDSYTNYIVIAFYEEKATAPALLLQVEKVKNSGQDKTKEDWLKILNILVEETSNTSNSITQ